MSTPDDLREPMFRCVRASRASGWPPLAVMADEARWNRMGQAAIYAAFDPDVAIEEKLQHAAMPMASAILVMFDLYSGGAVGGPMRLAIVTFQPPITSPRLVKDCRDDPDPRRSFRPFMEPGPDSGNPSGYEAPQAQGHEWERARYLRLVVPSYPFFARGELVWTNVFYVGGYEGVDPDSLPSLTLVRTWDQWIPLET